ncbi:MAG: TetR/AcrR family transcriptional regulator [Clostridia bacterium]
MATAFTPREKEQIYASLQDAATRCVASVGMRHITVDELAREAGISKGAFYRFFDSKEHLFLTMLERMHNEMYGSAQQVLETRMDLPIRARAILAVKEVCLIAEKNGAIPFIREEVPLLLRRLPEDLLAKHYKSDEERIRALILKVNVKLNTSIETACTVIRLLLMTLLLKGDVGEQFDEALRVLVEGACDRMLENP